MSEVLITAILATIAPTLLALATLILAIKSKAKVEQIHVATNSLKDELVAATAKASFAAGQKDENENPRLKRKRK